MGFKVELLRDVYLVFIIIFIFVRRNFVLSGGVGGGRKKGYEDRGYWRMLSWMKIVRE